MNERMRKVFPDVTGTLFNEEAAFTGRHLE
jgi:hypothetical protein